MMRRAATGLASLALLLQGAAASTTSSDDALDAGLNDEVKLAAPATASPAPAQPVTVVRVVPPPPAAARVLSANPLWAVPLSQLSGTRDRPVFSHSRRPPPPVAIAAEPVVVKPPPRRIEVEPPQITLVGTIASDDNGFGIFIDQSTKAALRLKVGDDYQGWKLHAIRGREVTLEKDRQTAVLTLLQPGGTPSGGEVRLVPVSAVTQR
jgi:hypothetical protein